MAPSTRKADCHDQIAIALFPRFTALDAIGPYEVLQRLPDTDIVFVGHERGMVRTENGDPRDRGSTRRSRSARTRRGRVPGGVGTRALMHDEQVLDWVRNAHETTTFTTSVCTGSLVLAAAGLLDGLTATTHWAATTLAARRDTTYRNVWSSTSTGGSSPRPACPAGSTWRCASSSCSSTDRGQGMQLMIEYDPQPPFDCGSLAKAAMR